MDEAHREEWKRRRHRSIEALFDPGTIRHLDSLGVSEGWRCLDLSAGWGTVTRWLCARVGCTGRVVATDPDWTAPEELAGAQFHPADAVFEAAGEGTCDLVRARSALAHLANRAEALDRMIACLKPGGHLLVEETDWISAAPVADFAAPSFERLYRSALRLWRSGGFDPEYGRRLAAKLAEAGLVDVRAEGRVYLMRGGTNEVEWLRLSLERLRLAAYQPSSLNHRQIERALALLDDPQFSVLSPTMMAAWGRRPS